MQTIPLNEGRRLFGHDPKVYAAARPEYPDVLYDRLKTHAACAREALFSKLVRGQGWPPGGYLALACRVCGRLSRIHA